MKKISHCVLFRARKINVTRFQLKGKILEARFRKFRQIYFAKLYSIVLLHLSNFESSLLIDICEREYGIAAPFQSFAFERDANKRDMVISLATKPKNVFV